MAEVDVTTMMHCATVTDVHTRVTMTVYTKLFGGSVRSVKETAHAPAVPAEPETRKWDWDELRNPYAGANEKERLQEVLRQGLASGVYMGWWPDPRINPRLLDTSPSPRD